MLYALFAATLLVVAGISFLIVLQLREMVYLEARIAEFKQTVAQFVTAPDADHPSPLASLVREIGQVMGRSVAATVMQKASADQRQLQGLERDMAADKLEAANPLLSGLAGALGKRTQKRVYSNPSLIQLATMLAGKMGAGGSAPVSSNHDAGDSFKIT